MPVLSRTARTLALVAGLACALPAAATNIFTIAGNGSSTPSGDGGFGNRAGVARPVDVSVDANGTAFVLDAIGKAVRKVTPDGIITTVATLPDTTGRAVTVAPDGTLYVAMLNAVRRIAPNGTVTTFAETANGMDTDRNGNLYFADALHNRIRRLGTDGRVSTVAGTGVAGNSGDYGPATNASLNAPSDVAFATDGTLYIADAGNRVIRELRTDGFIDLFHDMNNRNHLLWITNIAVDEPGYIYYTYASGGDTFQHVSTIGDHWVPSAGGIGNGTPGYAGDGPANVATLNTVRGLDLGPGGNLFLADTGNLRVRRARVKAQHVFMLAGYPDVLWRNRRTGENVAWEGAFVPGQWWWMRPVTDPNWEMVGMGSFLAENAQSSGWRGDLIWRNRKTGANAIWLGADSSKTLKVTAVTNLAWKIVGIADFDGDDISDLLWRNTSTGQNVIWKSASSTRQQAVATMSTAWQVGGTGDFWGDGKADILWHNPATGENVIWRSANVAMPQAVQSTKGWVVFGVVDYDGDTRSDVLWRNPGTGVNAIWYSADARRSRKLPTLGPDWTARGVGPYYDDESYPAHHYWHDYIPDIFWHNARTGENVLWPNGDASRSAAIPADPGADWVLMHQP